MTATIAEVRDAFAATLGPVAQVGKTTSSPITAKRGVVIGSSAPWFRAYYANGPTRLGREWNWELRAVVEQTQPEGDFDRLAALIEEIIDALLADATLGGAVQYCTVDQAGIVENWTAGGTVFLSCAMIVGVVS